MNGREGRLAGRKLRTERVNARLYEEKKTYRAGIKRYGDMRRRIVRIMRDEGREGRLAGRKRKEGKGKGRAMEKYSV